MQQKRKFDFDFDPFTRRVRATPFPTDLSDSYQPREIGNLAPNLNQTPYHRVDSDSLHLGQFIGQNSSNYPTGHDGINLAQMNKKGKNSDPSTKRTRVIDLQMVPMEGKASPKNSDIKLNLMNLSAFESLPAFAYTGGKRNNAIQISSIIGVNSILHEDEFTSYSTPGQPLDVYDHKLQYIIDNIKFIGTLFTSSGFAKNYHEKSIKPQKVSSYNISGDCACYDIWGDQMTGFSHGAYLWLVIIRFFMQIRVPDPTNPRNTLIQFKTYFQIRPFATELPIDPTLKILRDPKYGFEPGTPMYAIYFGYNGVYSSEKRARGSEFLRSILEYHPSDPSPSLTYEERRKGIISLQNLNVFIRDKNPRRRSFTTYKNDSMFNVLNRK